MGVNIPAGVTVDNIKVHEDGPTKMVRPDGVTISRPGCAGYTVTVWVDTRYIDARETWQDVAITAATLSIADPLGYYPLRLYGWADWRLVVVGRPVVLYRDEDEAGSGAIIAADVVLRFRFDPDGAAHRDSRDAEAMRY